MTIKYIKKLVHLIFLNQSKEMWAVLYVTYNVITSTILLNSIIDIFIFRCAIIIIIIIILTTDRFKIILL